jgi:superfamily II DNA/RNA helicase
MPREIAALAAQMLRDPAKVAVTPAASTVERVEQRIIHVDRAAKPAVLAEILRDEPIDRTLVFTRTKHGADKVVRGLAKPAYRPTRSTATSRRTARTRARAFRKGQVLTLVATDIAARGIDVDGISHVVNFDLPNVPETYVHRIGRTARAGAAGVAISLCDAEEAAYLRDIEKLIRMSIPARTSAGFRARPGQPRSRPHSAAVLTCTRQAATAGPHQRAAQARSTGAAAEGSRRDCRRRVPASQRQVRPQHRLPP